MSFLSSDTQDLIKSALGSREAATQVVAAINGNAEPDDLTIITTGDNIFSIAPNVQTSATQQFNGQNVIVSNDNNPYGAIGLPHSLLSGYVTSTGSITSGNGFTISYNPSSPGKYAVTYTTGYSSYACCVACVAGVLGAGPGFAMAVNQSTSGCEIYTFNSGGGLTASRDFTFIVMGV